MAMNPEIKARWVAALRSGEYEQASGCLRAVGDDDANKTLGFCCLGVLCNLHAEAHPRIAAKETNADRYLRESALLPELVREWARLPFARGAEVEINGFMAALTHHNDNGATFAQIADAIEEQL